MKKLEGSSIYEGVVIAKPYYNKSKKVEVETRRIPSDQVDLELNRFRNVIDETKEQIQKMIESLYGKVDRKDIKILNVHLMMLEDPVFLSDITNKVKIEQINVEAVIEEVVKKYVGMFKQLNDSNYKQRAIDIEDIGERLIANLQGRSLMLQGLDGHILVSEDLKPSTLLNYCNKGIEIKGLILEMGGETSHLAILAKTLSIPTLLRVKNIKDFKSKEDEEIILDTRLINEYAIIDPTKDELEWYKKEQKEYMKYKKNLKKLIGKPAMSKDQERIKINVNMGGIIELTNINNYDPDGIGLVRTEFIYMNSDHFPSEEEQLQAYKKIVDSIGKEKTVTIRTLDIGGDKKLNYFNLPDEENPFLGLRSIRLSLRYPDIFRTQIRAILRASSYGNIQIMYPMISSLEEVLSANEILEEEKKKLKKKEIDFNEDIKVGIMIEVPSAAIISDILAKEVDFFSIGTNDLTQYILASDRLSEEVSDIYDNYHPAVIRSIANIADNAIKEGIKVSVCGEMAGDKLAMLAFLSFGIKDFSMLPSVTLKIKKIISTISIKDLGELRENILQASTSEELKNILNDYLIGVM
ncbi:MAG: phosphoenolpyruvate--protein phosphotransferase [Fusobacteriota bacterium]